MELSFMWNHMFGLIKSILLELLHEPILTIPSSPFTNIRSENIAVKNAGGILYITQIFNFHSVASLKAWKKNTWTISNTNSIHFKIIINWFLIYVVIFKPIVLICLNYYFLGTRMFFLLNIRLFIIFMTYSIVYSFIFMPYLIVNYLCF